MRTWLLLLVVVLGGCPDAPAPSPSDDDDATDDDDDVDSWERLRDAIDAADLPDVTLLIGTADGVAFSHSKGSSTAEQVYPLASASKWLSSITALKLAEAGVLALEDAPQDHLDWWASDPTDGRRDITLEQLLAFTSGFQGDMADVSCVEDGGSTLDACAREIHDTQFAFDPGTTFYYGPAHQQVAGAMAAAATGRRWNRLFREQIGDPLGLEPTTGFALPSLDNPRVAGGGTASANDYGTILTALVGGALLAQASVEVMSADHTGDGVLLASVPEAVSEGSTWHYALGCWRECDGEEYTAACDEPGVLSSPGLFGFYPWWDQARGFWGVLATQVVDGAGRTVPLGQAWSELAAEVLETR